MARAAAVATGVAADAAFGEPPDAVHPVAAFGRSMHSWEGWLWKDARLPGLAYAASGACTALVASAMLETAVSLVAGQRKSGRLVAGWISPRDIATAVAVYTCVAGRSLAAEAGKVGAALERGDLAEARSLLPALAGRDPEVLDVRGVAAAVIESVAENTVDAVVAPVFWAAVGGAPGVTIHRAVNTLDAMVGYRNRRYVRFGWASARLDDAMAYLPARWTAHLVSRWNPGARGEIREVLRSQARAHPSPNAGVAEGAFAAALGIRLGGVTVYRDRTEIRPVLGFGRTPEVHDIARAVELSRAVAGAAVRDVFLVVVGAAAARRKILR